MEEFLDPRSWDWSTGLSCSRQLSDNGTINMLRIEEPSIEFLGGGTGFVCLLSSMNPCPCSNVQVSTQRMLKMEQALWDPRKHHLLQVGVFGSYPAYWFNIRSQHVHLCFFFLCQCIIGNNDEFSIQPTFGKLAMVQLTDLYLTCLRWAMAYSSFHC